MILKNRKGLSLTELLIVIALIGLVSPLLFYIMVAGMEDYATTTKYIDQQYTAMEVIRYIRQDIEEAKEITIYKDASDHKVQQIKIAFPTSSSKPEKIWKFDRITDKVDGKEYNGLGFSLDGGTTYNVVIDKLIVDDSNTNYSKFDLDSYSDPTRLILVVCPEKLNENKYRGRNVNENIITEFSVQYKIKKFEVIP